MNVSFKHKCRYIVLPIKLQIDGFCFIPDVKEGSIQWEPHFHETPTAIVIHIPFFVTLQTVVVDGKTFRMVPFDSTENSAFPHITPQKVILPATFQQVRLNWQYSSRPDEFSYQFFVQKFLLEYHWKLNQYRHGRKLFY